MKVSIIIANYNYERYLSAAIQSVLAQTYENWEIILIDDGSTDGSRSLIQQFQQRYPEKIQVIFQENQGHGEAINAGFKRCQGDIVALLDSDDLWHPSKVETIIPYFKFSEVVGVIHPLNTVNKESVVIEQGHGIAGIPNGDLAKLIMKTGNTWRYPSTSGLAFRRTALEKIIPMDPPEWRKWPDGCLLYCAAFLGKVYALDDVLASYRAHGENTHWTANPSEEQKEDSIEGVAMTNKWINNFLTRINYPGRVDLSQNLDYRRSQYYLRGVWNFREVLSLSGLIVNYPFYNFRDRLRFLLRLWVKNLSFALPSKSFVKTN
jgi:glycosyltransferase involved in cell wall biosynthesis